jgi:DNA-binding XRE family transcriptional regulator
VVQIDAARRRKREPRRNARVRKVAANEWQVNRIEKFRAAIRMAAAAKSIRTALGVTQREMARSYQVAVHTVTNWESGAYFGWSSGDLTDWLRRAQALAVGEAARKRA